MKISTLETKLASRYDEFDPEVCPWCEDEECGFISVKIDREDDIVIWRDFILNDKNLQVGPFYFGWENYKQAIENTFGTAGIQ